MNDRHPDSEQTPESPLEFLLRAPVEVGAELSRLVPRLVERTVSQVGFLAALADRLGCTVSERLSADQPLADVLPMPRPGARVVSAVDVEPPATGDAPGEGAATAKKAPATAKKAPATAKKAPATAKKAPATAKKAPATAKKAPATAKKAPATAKKAPATAKKAPATAKKRTRHRKEGARHSDARRSDAGGGRADRSANPATRPDRRDPRRTRNTRL